MKSEYLNGAVQEQVKPRHSSGKQTVSELTNDTEEMQALALVRDLLKFRITPCRLTLKQTKTYAAIRLDEKDHRAICRLYLNKPKRYIGVLNTRKVETRYPIDAVSDIVNHTKEMLGVADAYDK